MKKLIVLCILALTTFSSNNAAIKKWTWQKYLPGQASNIPVNTSFIDAARHGNDQAIDMLLTHRLRTKSNEEDSRALALAIYGGHLSIVKKLLFFFGDEVSSGDADWAFGAACLCDDETTARAMVEELCEYKIFVTMLSKTGYDESIRNANSNRYYWVNTILQKAKSRYTNTQSLILRSKNQNVTVNTGSSLTLFDQNNDCTIS